MKKHDHDILCKLKERLSHKIGLLDMRVFGSRACGDYDEFSDLDVFIETETLNKNIKEITWEVGSYARVFRKDLPKIFQVEYKGSKFIVISSIRTKETK